MSVIKTTAILIERNQIAKGSNCRTWNVSVDGRPYGQIWTFKGRLEIHRYHAKTLKEDYANFATYAEAETFMRGTI